MKTKKNKIVIILLAVVSLLPSYSFAQQIFTLQITAGANHSISLCSDSMVRAWGANGVGQLGDGTTIDRTNAVQVKKLNGIIAIACGYHHSLALKNDGTVWAWGSNMFGQLGDGTTIDRTTAVQVKKLNGIIDIECGANHSLALKNDGTVWAWGWNDYGQLGNGTINTKGCICETQPVQVIYLTGITSIAGGLFHSVALKNDSTVWTWGNNSNAQLGDGTITATDRTTPGQVMGLMGITAISSGSYHSLALKNDGTVWAWGANNTGQLGIGTQGYVSPIPVQTIALSAITIIASGGFHSMAMKNDGTVWVWGDNQFGQIGDGTGGGGYSCWGTNCFKLIPVQVSGLTGVLVIAGGLLHSLALKNNETVWAWGYNHSGQLGDGTTIDRITPIQVIGPCIVQPPQDCSNFKCGNNNEKILICHIPPGNTGNPQTLCISPSALDAHLAHGDVCGPCGSGKQFATTNEENAESGIDEREFIAEKEFKVNVYPNPFSGKTKIIFKATQEGMVKLEIFNAKGQIVATLFDGVVVSGKNYSQEFNAENLPAGIYFYRITTANEILHDKLVIVKL